ncbi:hypothetical protein OG875_05110 [Streptomyces sp. NBC_01498]|uniref:hypothetical protein n=1 Tax=Streptomyces sp. NBC_01498 TaxID=2975870 RepID=UPI002E7B2621|nr:hypothetical protein [Streptomyces sp. NBC_01498]WTL24037.1 hypothetical protein OG875_05110 [Streptomyces sp. NBC_01498]
MTAPVVYLVIPLALIGACAWLIALLTSERRERQAAARRAERAARPGTAREDALAFQLADARAQIRRLEAALAAQKGHAA